MKAERWIATQAVALGKNCDGVRTGLDNNLCFEGIGAICVANRRKGQSPFYGWRTLRLLPLTSPSVAFDSLGTLFY